MPAESSAPSGPQRPEIVDAAFLGHLEIAALVRLAIAELGDHRPGRAAAFHPGKIGGDVAANGLARPETGCRASAESGGSECHGSRSD
jgi:hypothetical protein